MEEFEAHQIKDKVQDSILRKPNVVATGIGYKNGDPEQGIAIIASVTKKKPPGLKKNHISRMQRVGKQYDGLQTDVQETGNFYALISPTDRIRPIPAGVSIGHVKISAGTHGAWVKHEGIKVMLSNNHVLANSNDAKNGDPIVQPGIHDGADPNLDTVAVLTNFIPIVFEGAESDCDAINMIVRSVNFISRSLGRKSELRSFVTSRAADNLVDAAIATPINPGDIKDELIDGSKFNGIAELKLGDKIKKWGRTTGYTEGQIIQVGVTVNVGYGTTRFGRFINQLMAGAMSEGGDSGSAVTNFSDEMGGLLFAGSRTNTIINPIQSVFSALKLNL